MNTDPIRTLIVDDELLSREVARHMASSHADLLVVGECASVKSALESIRSERPDLIFLDVEMPGANGFELIDSIEADSRPWIIFTTAYGRHAVKAFEARAVDYLEKPFSQERFDEAISRIRQLRRLGNEASLGRNLKGILDNGSRAFSEMPARYPERIAIKTAGKVYFIEVSDIEYLEASGNYVEIWAGGKAHLAYGTISSMERDLDTRRFLRIHRSQIVNMTKIKELQPHFNGEYIVTLNTGAKLKISRSYRDQARAALGLE